MWSGGERCGRVYRAACLRVNCSCSATPPRTFSRGARSQDAAGGENPFSLCAGPWMRHALLFSCCFCSSRLCFICDHRAVELPASSPVLLAAACSLAPAVLFPSGFPPQVLPAAAYGCSLAASRVCSVPAAAYGYSLAASCVFVPAAAYGCSLAASCVLSSSAAAPSVSAVWGRALQRLTQPRPRFLPCGAGRSALLRTLPSHPSC